MIQRSELLRLLPFFLAIVFLFADFKNAAIHIHDEGHFLLAGNTITSGVFGVIGGQSLPEISAELHQSGGTLFFAAKPGHVALMAFAGLFGGLTAGKALVLMALLTVATVLLMQSIGEAWYGKEWGWLAGLATACSPLLLEYGKTVLSPVSSLFFAVLCLWFLQQQHRRCLMHVLAGVAAAGAILCHYNTLPLLFAMMVSHLHRCRPRDVAGAFLGGLFFLLASEGVLLLADKSLQSAYPEFRSFFGELMFNLNKNHLSGKVFQQFDSNAIVTDGVRGYALNAYIQSVGWILVGFSLPLGVMLLGLFAPIGKQEEAENAIQPQKQLRETRSILAWIILFPLVVWLAYPWKIERNFVQCLPGLVLAFPLGCYYLMQYTTKQRVILGAVSICLAGMLLNYPLREKSPIEQVIELNQNELRALPTGAFTATSFPGATSPLWKWYLGPEQRQRGRVVDYVDFSTFEDSQMRGTDFTETARLSEWKPWGKPMNDLSKSSFLTFDSTIIQPRDPK